MNKDKIKKKMSAEEVVQYLTAFSAGSANDLSHTHLWVKSAGMVFDQLDRLQNLLGYDAAEIIPIERFSSEQEIDLGRILTRQRSDKEFHRYHLLYAHIFEQLGRQQELKVLEIGLGTNNPSLISTMGPTGRPGASLYAWAEYLPHAQIYGADIDTEILFQDPSKNIRTAFVDQLEPATLENLPTLLGQDKFDLIIDDGLHSFAANMNTLLFALKFLKPNGWLVIEDIHNDRVNSWRLVQSLFKNSPYKTYLIRSVHAHIYALRVSPRTTISGLRGDRRAR